MPDVHRQRPILGFVTPSSGLPVRGDRADALRRALHRAVNGQDQIDCRASAGPAPNREGSRRSGTAEAVADAPETHPRAGECALGLKTNPRILNDHAQAGSVDACHDWDVASVLGRRDPMLDGVLDQRLEQGRHEHVSASSATSIVTRSRSSNRARSISRYAFTKAISSASVTELPTVDRRRTLLQDTSSAGAMCRGRALVLR